MVIRSEFSLRRRNHFTAFNLVVVLFTIGILIFFLFPLYWQIATSFKVGENAFKIPPQLFPNPLTLDRYRWVFQKTPFLLNVRNSLIVSSFTTIICLVFSTLASYALARLSVPGSKTIMLGVLICSMLPAVSIIGPLYLTFKKFKLINSFLGLGIAYTAFFLPFTMWFLTSFFKTLPVELEEAAEIDGCTPFQTLYQIMIPLSAPAIFTVLMMVFIFSWNEYLFSFTFMSTDPVRTYPVGLVMLQGLWEMPWCEISAASTVVVIPVVILVLVAQKYIIQGLTAGALKG
jgi:multiple sugar transport system permease protein